MATFEKKTWADRVSEFPTRRTLTDVSTGTAQIVTVARTEGEVTNPGDAFNAQNMNDLEDRIDTVVQEMDANFQAGVDAVYDACVAQGVTPSASTPEAIATAIGNLRKTPYTQTYKPTVRANNNDMGIPHNKRYVDTTAIPNLNSGTYTFPANDTGATKDLLAANTVRYVNASNVYSKGSSDGYSSGTAQGHADKRRLSYELHAIYHSENNSIEVSLIQNGTVILGDGTLGKQIDLGYSCDVSYNNGIQIVYS